MIRKYLFLSTVTYLISATADVNAVGVSDNKTDLELSTFGYLKQEAGGIGLPSNQSLTLLPAGDPLPDDAISIKIGSDTYYYTATSNQELLQTLTSTPAVVVTDNGGGNYSLSYDMNNIPDSDYSLRELGASETAPFEITKYLTSVDANGNTIYTPIKYAVEFNSPVGNVGETDKKYYKWGTNSSGGLILEDVTSAVTGGSTDFNIEVDYDASNNNRISTNQNNNDLNQSFVGLKSSWASGAAISNSSGFQIGDINGDFIGNYTNGFYGGAVYNLGTIGNFTGNFIGNYLSASTVYGGAIYNRGNINNITGDFIGNFTLSNSGLNSFGGAIFNDGAINDITGDFNNNYLSRIISTKVEIGLRAEGGAIYNDEGKPINNIVGDFNNNSVNINYNYTGSSFALVSVNGGAIANNGHINNIIGDFNNNYSTAYSTSAYSNINSFGGAIYNSGQGSIDRIMGNFTGNYALHYYATGSSNGGAIYNYSNIGEIIGDFSGNYSRSVGGAIHNELNNVLANKIDLINGNFYDNYSGSGGAISNTGVIIEITGKFVNNYASASFNGGGAIYNQTYQPSTIINEINGTFIGNYSINSIGGAIYNGSTISNITGSFTDNGKDLTGKIQTTDGGAIANITDFLSKSNTNITIIGSSFTNNAAKSYGGAIYNSNEDETAYEANLTIGNSSDGTRSSFSGNSALSGGAIYSDTTKGTVEIDADFTGNYVTSTSGSARGGAIYNMGMIAEIIGSFTNNYAEGLYALGGGIYNNSVGTITLIDADFTGNYAKTSVEPVYGGGLFNEGVITEVIGNFNNNYITGSFIARGGAIYNGESTSNIDEITGNFNNNYIQVIPDSSVSLSAPSGGAIYSEVGNIGIIDGDFTSNYITTVGATVDIYARGGAVHNLGIMGSIYGNFIGNYIIASTTSASAYGYGGALHNREGSIASLNSNFSSNYVSSTSVGGALGGAIYNENATIGNATGLFIDNGRNTLGTVTDFGGAIYNYSGNDATKSSSIKITGSSFTGNVAKQSGGAIYNTDQGNGSAANLTIDSSSSGTRTIFSGNSAVTGGAIYNDSPNANITITADFSGNKATSTTDAKGGAIYNNGNSASELGEINIIDSTFTNNTSDVAESGGAIYNDEFGKINISSVASNVTFSGNTAGGVDNAIHNLGILDLTAGATSIIFDDIITGDGVININGTGNVYFNQNVSGSAINLSSGNLYLGQNATQIGGLNITGGEIITIDGVVKEYNLDSLDMSGATLAIDLDLTAQNADNFTIAGSAAANTSLLYVNVINPTNDVVNKIKVNIFNDQADNMDIELTGSAVDIVNHEQTIHLEQDTTDRGAYVYSVERVGENLNSAINMISDNTQYMMETLASGGYGDETIKSNTIQYEIPGSGVYTPKNMRVSGLSNGSTGFTVYSDIATNGGDAVLTLMEDSTLASVNVNWGNGSSKIVASLDGVSNVAVTAANVNFDMQGAGTNNITFGMLSGFNTTELYSNFTSSDINNEVIFNDNGEYNVYGSMNNLTVKNNSTLNARGVISGSIIENNGIINRYNYDDGNTYKINSTSVINFDDWNYLYDPTQHGTTYDLNSLDFNGGTFSLVDDLIQNIRFNDINMSSKGTLRVDVDLENVLMDNVDVNSFTTTGTKINIGMNLFNDALNDETIIDFTDSDILSQNLTYSPIAYSPIYQYEVSFDETTGKFTFDKGSEIPTYNPSLNAANVAEMANYSVITDIFEKLLVNTDNLDTYNLYKGLASGDDAHAVNTWVKAYGSKTDLKIGGFEVENETFGTIIGQDSKVYHLKNNMDAVYSGFVAIVGSNQEYENTEIDQRATMFGVRALFNDDSFFTGFTGVVGVNLVDITNTFGEEDYTSYSMGVSNKTGCSINIDRYGKLTIQPSMMFSYVYNTSDSYINSADLKVENDSLHALHIRPELKIMAKFNNMTAYTSIAYNWNVFGSADIMTDNVTLPSLELDNHAEIKLGIIREVNRNIGGFAEIGANIGGEKGIEAQIGLKWVF